LGSSPSPSCRRGQQVGFFRTQLQAVNGERPYAWATHAALPEWLTLTPGGVLSGTPPAAGFYHFVARVSSSDGASAAKLFTLQVTDDAPQALRPQLKITAPKAARELRRWRDHFHRHSFGRERPG
jgi:hypothetical protein